MAHFLIAAYFIGPECSLSLMRLLSLPAKKSSFDVAMKCDFAFGCWLKEFPTAIQGCRKEKRREALRKESFEKGRYCGRNSLRT